MLLEQPPQLPLADAEPFGQRIDARALAVERAVRDQGKAARDRVRRAAPRAEVGRRLRPAAQAGAEAGLLRRGGAGEEAAILELGGARRADRPAIDPGRGDADEQAPVEARVAALQRPVAGTGIEPDERQLFHGANDATAPAPTLAVFGHGHEWRRIAVRE